MGEQQEMSTCVNVLWVEKWVGLPSFNTNKLLWINEFSIISPRLLLHLAPHKVLQLFTSPKKSIGVFMFVNILFNSLQLNDFVGGIYMDIMVILIFNKTSMAIIWRFEFIFNILWEILFFISKPTPCFAVIFWT